MNDLSFIKISATAFKFPLLSMKKTALQIEELLKF